MAKVTPDIDAISPNELKNLKIENLTYEQKKKYNNILENDNNNLSLLKQISVSYRDRDKITTDSAYKILLKVVSILEKNEINYSKNKSKIIPSDMSISSIEDNLFSSIKKGEDEIKLNNAIKYLCNELSYYIEGYLNYINTDPYTYFRLCKNNEILLNNNLSDGLSSGKTNIYTQDQLKVINSILNSVINGGYAGYYGKFESMKGVFVWSNFMDKHNYISEKDCRINRFSIRTGIKLENIDFNFFKDIFNLKNDKGDYNGLKKEHDYNTDDFYFLKNIHKVISEFNMNNLSKISIDLYRNKYENIENFSYIAGFIMDYLVKYSPNPTIIIKGKDLVINEAFLKLSGYSRDELNIDNLKSKIFGMSSNNYTNSLFNIAPGDLTNTQTDFLLNTKNNNQFIININKFIYNGKLGPLIILTGDLGGIIKNKAKK